MKKAGIKRTSDGMRTEYDFSSGQRGRYAGQIGAGANVIVLAPDVARVFPNSKAVNDALRSLVRLAQKSAG